jgi:Transposase
MFVGWDWASTTHDLTVLDDAGAVVDRWALRHTEQDLAGALDRLARLGEPAALPVIIERTSGLVVDRLVAAGHPVVPVHPTAFWAASPRWGASGAKSDAGDSDKLADYLRTDGTGSAGWIGPTRASRSSRPWCGCARTTCGPAPQPATSSAPC